MAEGESQSSLSLVAFVLKKNGQIKLEQVNEVCQVIESGYNCRSIDWVTMMLKDGISKRIEREGKILT